MIREPFTIRPMTRPLAMQISTWTYEAPYDVYNVRTDPAAIEEVLSDEYFTVSDASAHLIGYFCFGEAARVSGGWTSGAYTDDSMMDIGLGMRPSLTGQGYGGTFLQQCLATANELYRPAGYRLSVASFNQRAIKVYERAGFVHSMTFAHGSFNRTFEFWLMERQEEP